MAFQPKVISVANDLTRLSQWRSVWGQGDPDPKIKGAQNVRKLKIKCVGNNTFNELRKLILF